MIRRGTLEQAEGNLEEAESLFRAALLATERASQPDEAALIGTMSALGQLLVARGGFEEAEHVLTRALDLAERAAGAHDDDLPILLNELSRLYLTQSAFAAAEPLLLRLLAIRQAQGEERPEVATVLASLASVREALGDYGDAEQLYRQALNIREKTLTPNHITTAATMESLAETCAARGHFTEAVSLCTRALAMREMTRGANDDSVRGARERIADLRGRASEESRVTTPPRSAPALQSLQPVAGPLTDRKTIDASKPAVVLIPWASELAAVQEELESSSPVAIGAGAPWRSVIAAKMGTRSSTAITATVGVVLVLAALGLRSQLGRKPSATGFVEAEPANPAAQRIDTAALQTPSRTMPLDARVVTSNRDIPKTVPSPVASRATSPSTSAHELPPRSAPRASVPVAQRHILPPAISPTISRPANNAAVAVASLPPTPPATDSVPDRSSSTVDKGISTRRRSESDNAPTAPTLLGTPPQPQYPDALRNQQVEGEVVVQFVVDENGQPDASSMTVVRSPHLLLTNAVRAVLPRFRYEPARTAPPRSTPRPETVRYAFTFHAPRK
jgi:TonB family protein